MNAIFHLANHFKRQENVRFDESIVVSNNESTESTAINESSGSAFKHGCTKYRSLKRADDALPKSPHKRKEIVSSLATKYQLRIQYTKNKRGRKRKNLTEEQKEWLINALDRPDISMMNPGKKDHVYVGKHNGVKKYEQKRYLLWPLRDLLEILHGNDNEDTDTTYSDLFDEKLSFSLFYRFLKEYKQYIHNNHIPHNTCLYEICENAVLLAKGISNACKPVETFLATLTKSSNILRVTASQIVA